jgi:hypothetical protein
MGLPIQSAPTYKTVLPSNGREIKFRPFLVKEQKVLMLAKEGEDKTESLEAVKNMINDVTFGEIDANDLAMIDLEWLFIQIRTKSVGESATVKMKCLEDDCSGTGEALINFEEVEVEGEILDNTIMVSDDVGVVLRLLKVEDTKDVQDMPENEVIFYLLNKSIDRIFDAESVYERTDISDADVDEFIENLTFAQLGQLSEYFEKTPKLTKEVSFKCEICGTQQSRVLEGLQNFF